MIRLWNLSRSFKANCMKGINRARKRMTQQNIFKFEISMLLHACKTNQRRISFNKKYWWWFENKNPWRIGRDSSMENREGLTASNHSKRWNQKDSLTLSGYCWRDFNACLFWIDRKGRAQLLLNIKTKHENNCTSIHRTENIRFSQISWKSVFDIFISKEIYKKTDNEEAIHWQWENFPKITKENGRTCEASKCRELKNTAWKLINPQYFNIVFIFQSWKQCQNISEGK